MRWDEEYRISFEIRKGIFIFWVWRKEEKEVVGKETKSWNLYLVVLNFFEFRGKVGGWRRVWRVWNTWCGECFLDVLFEFL